MEPLDHIIPKRNHPALTLSLPKKTGRVPKGTYCFTEQYCSDPGDDCRGVIISVLNEKRKQKAAIKFGFDQDGPFAGPYLDPASRQAPYADALLELFVDSLNTKPEWLDQLHRHYREVRQAVEGKPYRGKPFPAPGQLLYHVMPPPDLQAQIEQSLKALGKPVTVAAPQRRPAKPAAPAPREKGIDALLSRYLEVGTCGPINELLSLQSSVRQYFLQNDGAEEELATLLPELFQHSPQDDERIEASLRLLYDALQLLQFDLAESVGKTRMARLQSALAQHVFAENEDLDLRGAVSNTVVQSRVEILPVLREAGSRMMIASAGRSDLHDIPGEEIVSGILRSLHSLGVTSPFEAAEELLQLFTLNDPELQTALIAEMMEVDEPLLQEISALMLFHPEPEVRLGVSRILAASDGGNVSPQTLRRLIVSRNWFPEELRKNIDQAIVNARKGRVECAPLPRPGAVTVYATAIDGLGTQYFNIAVERGETFSKAVVVMRQGVGVVDASAADLKSRRELNRFLSQLKSQPNFSDSSLELVDLRVCQALDEGLRGGNLPKHWLLRCAELLGRDSWRPIRFDAGRELLQMREDLDAAPGSGDETDLCDGVDESATWHDDHAFLSSWMEEEEAVDLEFEARPPQGKRFDPAAAAEQLADAVMEQRRAAWLERLVWTALWLKASKKPPLPWRKMFHLAQTVAGGTVAMKEIPLMRAVAESSVSAYLARKQGSKTKTGER
jgi:hypothetical protein